MPQAATAFCIIKIPVKQLAKGSALAYAEVCGAIVGTVEQPEIPGMIDGGYESGRPHDIF